MPSSSISEIHAAWRELGFLPAACAVISLGSAVLGALFWPLFGLLLLWNVVLESLPVPQGTGESCTARSGASTLSSARSLSSPQSGSA
jgi:hypothetical protein